MLSDVGLRWVGAVLGGLLGSRESCVGCLGLEHWLGCRCPGPGASCQSPVAHLCYFCVAMRHPFHHEDMALAGGHGSWDSYGICLVLVMFNAPSLILICLLLAPTCNIKVD